MTGLGRPRIGITMGDPAGIGPEVIQKAIASLEDTEGLIVYGDSALFLELPVERVEVTTALEAIEAAARDLASGELDGVVTGPVSKACFQGAYPGHTELFAHRMETPDYAMTLTGPRLTVTCVTTHLPLRDVANALTVDAFVAAGTLLHDFLRRALGVEAPRLAVAGLNPHASDGGLFGDEEARVITPAIERMVEAGLDASGPWSPDTVFHHAVQGRFDAVLCAYHDQALIPFKLMHFSDGVNVTLGLPRPRTSPDHGPAYDLAGQGLADSTGMLRAIELAQRMAK